MFWRMTGLSATSPVDSILDKDDFTLEELLDEDEIIQECKALNSRLINFLRDRTQVEQLIRYIVEEAPPDAEKKRVFKFPFIACEIFTCEVDIILRTLVDDDDLMTLLFSFLKPDQPHSALLAGYFSKVVICLLLRKTAPLMNYVQGHQEIFRQLVDLIGITSIMEVLIRLIGADENIYSNYTDAVQWLEETDVLEMIVDKFSSSDSPEVHANAAEILCAITRYAPPGLAAKICSPSFLGRLFRHALEDSRPKSVLVHSLSVCISLVDPKRVVSSSNQLFRSHLSHGSLVTATPETIEGMLESLGELLKLLDVSSSEITLPTTYGSLHPPLGKHRLKIVEFISVLLTIGSEAAEKELIRLGAIKCALDLFFEYPFNNFLHHHVENIIGSCLENKRTMLTEHLLHDCDIVGKILAAEKQSILTADPLKRTIGTQGRSPPRIGNVGHMTRIANRLIQLGNNNSVILTHLQENKEWVDWHNNALLKRNTVENVYQWACGRPSSLQDRGRESDDEDFRDRDYDVAALASNLSQAFRYGIYSNDDIEEAHGSLERDDEDVYFDDESAEVVISSLRLGDDQESSSLFTNSNWFALEDERAATERPSDSLASPSPNSDGTGDAISGENDDPIGATTSLKASDPAIDTSSLKASDAGTTDAEPNDVVLGSDDSIEDSESSCIHPSPPNEDEKPPEWVEWRETLESGDLSDANPMLDLPNGELEPEKVEHPDNAVVNISHCLSSSADSEADGDCIEASSLPGKVGVVSGDENPTTKSAGSPEPNDNSLNSTSPVTELAVEDVEHKDISPDAGGK